MSEAAGSERGAARLTAEEAAALRAAVAELRAEIEARLRRRRRPAPGLADRARAAARTWIGRADVLGVYDRVREWLGTLGMEEQELAIDPFGFDPAALARARPVLDWLYTRWWRVEARADAELPADRPLLLVANRSGPLPFDGLLVAEAAERLGLVAARPRFLVEDWLLALPFGQPWSARLGAVRACPENAARLLRSGIPVVAFPEGAKGALKPYRERYRVQRFGRGGFVSLALRTGAAVVPVGVVGGDDTYPILARPALLERLLGVPIPLTPTFPWFGALGAVPLPARWRIRFGEPVRWPAEADPDDPLFVSRAREQVRARVQALVDAELRARPSLF